MGEGMEGILKEILNELKYHSKLLEGIYEYMDENRAKSAESKEQIKNNMEMLNAVIKGNPLLEKMMKARGFGGE